MVYTAAMTPDEARAALAANADERHHAEAARASIMEEMDLLVPQAQRAGLTLVEIAKQVDMTRMALYKRGHRDLPPGQG